MTGTAWDTKTEETIRKLWAEGLTASTIAARLGIVSRSAVCAKARRMNLPPRVSGGNLSRAQHRQQCTRRSAGAALGYTTAKVSKPKFERLPLPAEDVPVTVVKMADLEAHHCRWIHGDVGSQNWGYCGQTRVGPLSYCSEHQRKAYTAVYVPSRAIQNAECNWKIARAKKETVE